MGERSMTRINETLLFSLFEKPEPQPKNKRVKEYFDYLHTRIFPNPNDFIDFLTAQNIDRQYESAERIIKRLCYYANFPPSYYALMDVVCVEHYQKTGISNMDLYIPRDHFLHVVYLYMLGIYVFFYNPEFYSRIVSSNKYERQGNSVGNIECNCIKDFVSEWKYFCLFHDVGYTVEILGNSKIKSDKERKNTQEQLLNTAGGYKASFGKNETLKEITFWSTIEILSKLIFTSLVLLNSEEAISPNHKMFRQFMSTALKHYGPNNTAVSIEFDNIPQTILSGQVLDRVFSNHCLKRLTPVLNINRITVIGIDRESGKLGFIFYHGENGSGEFVFTEDASTSIQSLLATPDLLLFDDYEPSQFNLLYLLNDNTWFIDQLKSLGVNSYYEHTSSQLCMKYKEKYKEITDEAQFLDFSYLIFDDLCTQIGSNYYGSILESYLDGQLFSFGDKNPNEATNAISSRNKKIAQRVLSSIEKYQKELLDNCNTQLIDEINKRFTRVMSYNSLDNLIDQHIDCYFDCVSDIANDLLNKKVFKHQISKEIEKKIDNEIKLLHVFSQLYIQVRSTLDNTVASLDDSQKKPWFEYDYSKGKVTAYPTFLEEMISTKICDRMKMTMEKVSSEYQLLHGITIDHGIASAYYAGGIFHGYRLALERADIPQKQFLLSVLLDIPGRIDDHRIGYISDYDHVFTSVLYAIYTHNLYPSHFSGESNGQKYKTRMIDPLSYLALLCDNLQDWNRPKSLHPAWMDSRPIQKASEEYDIQVSEVGIIISDVASKSTNWIDDKIEELSAFLDSVTSYVKKKR
jgi:hypothetical protein